MEGINQFIILSSVSSTIPVALYALIPCATEPRHKPDKTFEYVSNPTLPVFTLLNKASNPNI